jgi:hypothetical protein
MIPKGGGQAMRSKQLRNIYIQIYICYIHAFNVTQTHCHIRCNDSHGALSLSFGNGCISSSFFSFILTSNKIPISL